MRGEFRCQVSGCNDAVVVLLPAVSWTVCTFAQLAAAPVHQCCARHEGQVSDRYAAAVQWTLLKDSAEGHPADMTAVRTVCELLQGMRTPRAQSAYMTLTRLMDTP